MASSEFGIDPFGSHPQVARLRAYAVHVLPEGDGGAVTVVVARSSGGTTYVSGTCSG